MTFGAFFQENLGSFALLAMVLAMLFVVEQKRMKTQVPKISALGVAGHLNAGAVLVDLRDANTFKLGHIAGAKNDPKLAEHLNKYDKTQRIILCDESGLRAPTLANQMQAQGFVGVMVLNNGMQGWLEENFPVVK